ncbi:hypothetical protein DFH06DRAFT_1194521 [Mycena polygramma]|nr:hypothetical protein DFH06DRAFT_1194521 [Mycena polygramma]
MTRHLITFFEVFLLFYWHALAVQLSMRLQTVCLRRLHAGIVANDAGIFFMHMVLALASCLGSCTERTNGDAGYHGLHWLVLFCTMLVMGGYERTPVRSSGHGNSCGAARWPCLARGFLSLFNFLPPASLWKSGCARSLDVSPFFICHPIQPPLSRRASVFP